MSLLGDANAQTTASLPTASSAPENLGMQNSLAALTEGFGILLRSLYPVSPHITHVLWAELGYAVQYGELLDAPWPVADEAALHQDEIELMLQINGKLRGSIFVPSTASKEAIEVMAIAHELVLKQLGGSGIKRVVVVPGRLVNVVL